MSGDDDYARREQERQEGLYQQGWHDHYESARKSAEDYNAQRARSERDSEAAWVEKDRDHRNYHEQAARADQERADRERHYRASSTAAGSPQGFHEPRSSRAYREVRHYARHSSAPADSVHLLPWLMIVAMFLIAGWAVSEATNYPLPAVLLVLVVCVPPVCFVLLRKNETWTKRVKQIGFLLFIYLVGAGILAIQARVVR
jgi:Flp pilus assembly protein TadB